MMSLESSPERRPDTAIDVVLGSAPDGTLEPAQGRTLWLVLWLVLGPARRPVLWLVLGPVLWPVLWLVLWLVVGLVLGPFPCQVLGLVLGSPSDRAPEQALDRTAVLVLAKARGAVQEPLAAAAAAAATAAAALETPRAALHPEAGQCPGPQQFRGPWPHTASGLGS